jgi:hypothetical protein
VFKTVVRIASQIIQVHALRSCFCKVHLMLSYHPYIIGVPGRLGGSTPPPPQFRSFDKAESNSQFHGKYIRNNLITHFQIEWNPRLGGYRPQIPVLSALCPQLNLLTPPPPTRKNSWVRHWELMVFIILLQTEHNCVHLFV